MKISDFIKRTLIYNVSFIIIYVNLKDSYQESNFVTKANEFKRNFLFLLEKLNINQNQQLYSLISNLLNTHYIITFQVFIAGLLLFSILSVLTNKKLFSFFYWTFFTLYTAIYYNPLLPENKIHSMYGIRNELILSIGVIIVIFLNIFNSEESSNSEEIRNKSSISNSSKKVDDVDSNTQTVNSKGSTKNKKKRN